MDQNQSTGVHKRSGRETARLGVVAVLAAAATAFALFNLDEVTVNLLVAKTTLPLIIVIAACVIVGAGIGMLLGRGRRRS